MKSKLIIQIVLVAVIIFLGYLLYDSLMKPIRFENEFNRRKEPIIAKLKEIRTLEESYRTINGKYCGDIDTMVAFLTSAKVPVVKKIGNVPDSLSEAEAIKRGIVKRDTSYVNPIQKLREEGKLFASDEDLKTLKVIPFSEGKMFDVTVDSVERSGLILPVIEVKAHYNTFLHGMDEQMLRNRIVDVEHNKKYPGWKIGSLEQPIIDGNFE